MKRLAKTFKKFGFKYKQLKRGEKAFLYQQYLTESEFAYEVFMKKIALEYIIGNVIIEGHEQFPTDKSFGIWAWSYRDYPEALKKFNELEGIEIESKIFPKFVTRNHRERAKG